MAYQENDWLEFWRELALRLRREFETQGSLSLFNRKDRAAEYDSRSKKKNRERPDPLLDFVRGEVKPDETVLDVGAGTGRWTLPLARLAKKVTAVEPSPAMADILKENAREAGLDNIEIVPATWEEAVVAPHDRVISAHAAYGSPDLAAFVRKMEKAARRECYLALRLFPVEGVMAELCRLVYGHPHDSPNFIVAYNALVQMGIYGSVLIEEASFRWTSPDMESALARAKRHLALGASTEYDTVFRGILEKRLIRQDEGFLWPDGMRSALVRWQPPESEGVS